MTRVTRRLRESWDQFRHAARGLRRHGPARNRSWVREQPGQGGEGLSKGYGGSSGAGTGPSGPEDSDKASTEFPIEKGRH